jgi:hypothetical protein
MTALALNFAFVETPIASLRTCRTQSRGELGFPDRLSVRIFSRSPWHDCAAIGADEGLFGSVPLGVPAALGAGILAQCCDFSHEQAGSRSLSWSMREKVVESGLGNAQLAADLATLQLSTLYRCNHVGNCDTKTLGHLLGRKHLRRTCGRRGCSG